MKQVFRDHPRHLFRIGEMPRERISDGHAIQDWLENIKTRQQQIFVVDRQQNFG
jgi:hypothetical protein